MSWNDERPMSPHLQIYKLPLTALLSILHRATGAVLFLGLIIMVLALHYLATGEQHWIVIQQLLSSWLGLLILIGLTFSLYYHFCNGIRHLIWDLGALMCKQSLNKTGFTVLFLSIFLTTITWLIAYLN